MRTGVFFGQIKENEKYYLLPYYCAISRSKSAPRNKAAFFACKRNHSGYIE